MSRIVRTRAFAPGSIGNLGPGLDILGCAVDRGGDEVVAEWGDGNGVMIAEAGHSSLSRDPTRHAAGIAALAVLRRAESLGVPVARSAVCLRVKKGLPLAAGQGGSAASAVAGAAAVNALLEAPLEQRDLLGAALAAEERVAGRHLDNIAPSLLGGIVLIRSLDPIDVISLPVPASLRIVLAEPAQQLRTAESRAVLPLTVSRDLALHQSAQVAAIVAACYLSDLALLGRSIDDRLAEPARAPLLPGFRDAKRAALKAGALGVSISGAGPTAFALCDGDASAATVATAMHEAYAAAGVACVARAVGVNRQGTTVDVETSASAPRATT